MTWHGWLTLATELLIIGIVLGAGARLGQRIYRFIRAEIRTAKIQAELDAMHLQIEASPATQHVRAYRERRAQLEGLATASDKQARRITH